MTDPEEQLDAVAAVQDKLGPQQQRGRRQLAGLCIGLGALLGLMHLVVIVVSPERSLPAFLIACAVIMIAIAALTFGYLRVRRLRPAGGGRRYLVALAISMALYLAGLAVASTVGETLPAAIAIAVAIAAPLAIAAGRELRG